MRWKFFGPKEFITPYKITQNWVKNGLKFIRGNKREFLFKLEWIEEFIEEIAEDNKKKVIPYKENNNRESKHNFTHVH